MQTKDMNMSNSVAVIPTYSPADIANARAYAIRNGNSMGNRGRVPAWALREWNDALRPVLVQPKATTGVGRGKHTGKRGGASTVQVEGTTHTVTTDDARNARAWATENGITLPTRGRTPIAVLTQWVDAGMPTYREEVATVYYRALDKRNRLNGKERIAIVYRDMMGTGKPRMSDYWTVLGITGIPIRIVTSGMLIDVSRNDDGELIYRWVSKADNAEVVAMLKANIALV